MKHALFVRLEAKPGKEKEVAQFLQAGLGCVRMTYLLQGDERNSCTSIRCEIESHVSHVGLPSSLAHFRTRSDARSAVAITGALVFRG
jgi:hypothetical protein